MVGSGGIVKETGDLGGERRDDGGVEERVESGKDNATDHDTDDDLDTRIDVALAGYVGNGGLGVDGSLG